MKRIFVNLKRFEVPRSLGGVCPSDDPRKWAERVVSNSVELGLGRLPDMKLTYLMPEALVLTAASTLRGFPLDETRTIEVGCQGVFREDVKKGGNFGAFTTNLPATAARNLGCTWTIIGHSEERADKLGLLTEFEPQIADSEAAASRAGAAVDRVVAREVASALDAGLDVLLCVGETARERGEGSFSQQQPRIREVLRGQLIRSLLGSGAKASDRQIVIGYEPVWAIGPGKVPPGKDYISFVSSYVKEVVREEFGFEPEVVYGGGLKEENAGMISEIPTIDGGLVAPTRFTGTIGFDTGELKGIIEKYQQ